MSSDEDPTGEDIALYTYFKDTIQAHRELNYETIKDLLDKGADPNTEDPNTHEDDLSLTPLSYYVNDMTNPDPRIVELLLKYGADPNIPYGSSEWTLYPIVAALKKPEIVELLLRYGADPNKSRTMSLPLLDALSTGIITKNKVANIALLLQYGADINAKDSKGRSFLSSIESFPEDKKQAFTKIYKDAMSELERKEKIKKSLGEPEAVGYMAKQIILQPGGRKERSIRATNPHFKTEPETFSGLCKDLESNLYKDELYELALELDLPVTKRTTKKELCAMIVEYSQ